MSRTFAALWMASAALFVSAIQRPFGATDPDTTAVSRAPRLLSETGLYVGDGTTAVDARNRPFAPQYPLWSDGAHKRRWVHLPPDAQIDVSNVDRWDFPVGTRFWKEFEFQGRRIETRLLWKARADEWVFATYAWNTAQTDAELVPDTGMRNVVEVAPNRRHSIPSIADCRSCHDSARTEILGFNALQLSTDRDPNALHAEPPSSDMVTLATLVSEHRLSPARPEFVADPPRIRAEDPRTRAALGYLSANCGNCHNAESSIASVGLLLKYLLRSDPECTPALATTVGRPGHWQVPGAPEGSSQLIHPNRPDRSAIVHRTRSRSPSSQMPPLGSVVRDREAVDLLTAWVAESPDAWARRTARCVSTTR